MDPGLYSLGLVDTFDTRSLEINDPIVASDLGPFCMSWEGGRSRAVSWSAFHLVVIWITWQGSLFDRPQCKPQCVVKVNWTPISEVLQPRVVEDIRYVQSPHCKGNRLDHADFPSQGLWSAAASYWFIWFWHLTRRPPRHHASKVLSFHPNGRQKDNLSQLASERLGNPQEGLKVWRRRRMSRLPRLPYVACHHDPDLDKWWKMDGWVDGWSLVSHSLVVTRACQKQRLETKVPPLLVSHWMM